MKNYRYYAALLAVICLFTGWLNAQNVTGAVSGIVTDPSGAVIPNATVIVHNVGTGVDTSVTTNEVGLYSARFLPIGQYQVTVSAAGFTTSKFTPFTLEINQTAKFDAKLEPGEPPPSRTSAPTPLLSSTPTTPPSASHSPPTRSTTSRSTDATSPPSPSSSPAPSPPTPRE